MHLDSIFPSHRGRRKTLAFSCRLSCTSQQPQADLHLTTPASPTHRTFFPAFSFQNKLPFPHPFICFVFSITTPVLLVSSFHRQTTVPLALRRDAECFPHPPGPLSCSLPITVMGKGVASGDSFVHILSTMLCSEPTLILIQACCGLLPKARVTLTF